MLFLGKKDKVKKYLRKHEISIYDPIRKELWLELCLQHGKEAPMSFAKMKESIPHQGKLLMFRFETDESQN